MDLPQDIIRRGVLNGLNLNVGVTPLWEVNDAIQASSITLACRDDGVMTNVTLHPQETVGLDSDCLKTLFYAKGTAAGTELTQLMLHQCSWYHRRHHCWWCRIAEWWRRKHGDDS